MLCSAFSSLLSIFHSRSRTAESLGPSALACLEHRLPSVFIAFTETSEKILLLSCNLSVFLFSRQYQLDVLGLYICLTCLFSILIKKTYNLVCILSVFGMTVDACVPYVCSQVVCFFPLCAVHLPHRWVMLLQLIVY